MTSISGANQLHLSDESKLDAFDVCMAGNVDSILYWGCHAQGTTVHHMNQDVIAIAHGSLLT